MRTRQIKALISSVCLAWACAALADPSPLIQVPDAAPGDWVYGIDVYSKYDSIDIDFAQIKATGYQFVFLKLSEGAANPQGTIQYQNDEYDYWDAERQLAVKAKQAGLKVGYYHFAHPDIKGNHSPEDEAANVLKNLQSCNKGQPDICYPAANFPIVLDFEAPEIIRASTTAKGRKFLENWVARFVAAMNRKKEDVMMYSYRGGIETLKGDPSVAAMPLWFAFYTWPVTIANTQHHLASHNSNALPWTDFQIVQLADSGFVSGIDGGSNHGKRILPGLIAGQTEFLNTYFGPKSGHVTCRVDGKIAHGEPCKPSNQPYVDINLMRKAFFDKY
jgi:GH25 family lysozyme M1 (1,4-beta-N-acetylmuramidase)